MGLDIAELRASGNDVMLVQWSAIDTHMSGLYGGVTISSGGGDGGGGGGGGDDEGKLTEDAGAIDAAFARAPPLFQQHRTQLEALFWSVRDPAEEDKAPVGAIYDKWTEFAVANGCVPACVPWCAARVPHVC
jgi:hypothetical protein